MCPKISVIIPVYNTEKHLVECLDSIVNQTLKDIEIICVDDGSTDSSPEILQTYKAKDSRIQIFSQENKGQSAARNVGIRIAQGEYIYFMDSDDILKLNALEICYQKTVELQLDILYFDAVIPLLYETEVLKEKFGIGTTSYYRRKKEYGGVWKGTELYVQMKENDDYMAPPYLQLLRLSFLRKHDLFFYEGIYFEDNLFNIQCILSAERVSHIKTPLYIRRIRENSTVTSQGYKYFQSALILFFQQISFSLTKDWEPDVSQQVKSELDGRLMLVKEKYTELSPEEKEKIKTKPPVEQFLFKLIYPSLMNYGQTISALYKDIDTVRHSWSFRIGQIVLWLPSLIKRKINKPKKQVCNECDYIFNNKRLKNLFSKKKKQIFIFGGVPFNGDGGGQRSTQIAKTFNKMGYKVHYIYAFIPKVRLDTKIPVVTHIRVNAISSQRFGSLIDKDDWVVFEYPHVEFLPFLAVAKKQKAKIIYENIDNWETSLGAGSWFCNGGNLKKMLEKADLLVGTAQPLVTQLNDYLQKFNIEKKEILYLANAVDDHLFNPNVEYHKPSDMVIGEKTMIYLGALWGEWFDWELVYGIAENFPTYSINLIGDAKNILEYLEEVPENVHFLGLKKQVVLPAYLHYSDITLIPFKLDEIGIYVSPLKIFEYIAMNKIVLSTPLPDIQGYPNTYTGETVEEWVEILKGDLVVDASAAKDFISKNNWQDRCSKMIDYFFEE